MKIITAANALTIVSVPEDGDDGDASGVEATFQALLDRTEWVRQRTCPESRCTVSSSGSSVALSSDGYVKCPGGVIDQESLMDQPSTGTARNTSGSSLKYFVHVHGERTSWADTPMVVRVGGSHDTSNAGPVYVNKPGLGGWTDHNSFALAGIVEMADDETIELLVSLGDVPTLTFSGTPSSDSLEFVVDITTTGTVGSTDDAVYRWSSDGGSTWTNGVTATEGPTALGATGVSVAFAVGSYAANTRYTIDATTGPSLDTGSYAEVTMSDVGIDWQLTAVAVANA